MSRPSNTRLPLVGRSSPPSSCSRVDLPWPVGPWMASMSPSLITTSTPCSACTVSLPRLYCFVRPVISYMSVLSLSGVGLGDLAQGVGGAQRGGAPAAEPAGDQAAEHGQRHGEQQDVDRHGRGQVHGD